MQGIQWESPCFIAALHSASATDLAQQGLGAENRIRQDWRRAVQEGGDGSYHKRGDEQGSHVECCQCGDALEEGRIDAIVEKFRY